MNHIQPLIISKHINDGQGDKETVCILNPRSLVSIHNGESDDNQGHSIMHTFHEHDKNNNNIDIDVDDLNEFTIARPNKKRHLKSALSSMSSKDHARFNLSAYLADHTCHHDDRLDNEAASPMRFDIERSRYFNQPGQISIPDGHECVCLTRNSSNASTPTRTRTDSHQLSHASFSDNENAFDDDINMSEHNNGYHHRIVMPPFSSSTTPIKTESVIVCPIPLDSQSVMTSATKDLCPENPFLLSIRKSTNSSVLEMMDEAISQQFSARKDSMARSPSMQSECSVKHARSYANTDDGEHIFTPKRQRTESKSTSASDGTPNGRVSFVQYSCPSNSNSRFRRDFVEVGVVGGGSYGIVKRVRSRIESCEYAIKESRNPFRGSNEKDRALKEVFALAALSTTDENPHIVRYFDSWIEDQKLFIKTELCDENLTSYLKNHCNDQSSPEHLEKIGIDILRQILDGLKCLHSHQMVHLDLKPDNIFVKGDVFKIGDFGHVTMFPPNMELQEKQLRKYMIKSKSEMEMQSESTHQNINIGAEEGDSRYMAKELLNSHHEHLPKADIFSLGATIYEIFMQKRLPPNGDEWADIRDGKLDSAILSKMSSNMQELIRMMMHPDPTQRPTAEELIRTGGPNGMLLSNEKDMYDEIDRLKKEIEQLRRINMMMC